MQVLDVWHPVLVCCLVRINGRSGKECLGDMDQEMRLTKGPHATPTFRSIVLNRLAILIVVLVPSFVVFGRAFRSIGSKVPTQRKHALGAF